jgi:hypothetical protein
MLFFLTLATACLDGFVISQGGVGSSSFMRHTEQLVHINHAGDADGVKHAFPSAFRFKHGLHTRTACASRALVIIGDPFHSVKSVVRRFKMGHINKLRAHAKRPAMTLAAFNGLSEARQVQASAAIDFMHAWLNVNVTYVKVVSTNDLYKKKGLWQTWLKTGQYRG